MRISDHVTSRLRPRRSVAAIRFNRRRPTLEALEDRNMLSAAPPAPATELLPGDANQDLTFDQLDLLQVLQMGKYLTGQPATWAEGDWNGAPGGRPGNPPLSDGLFNQRDIVTALTTGVYANGPYGAIAPGGVRDDIQTSIIYDPETGEIGWDAPAGRELTAINMTSAAGIFTGWPRAACRADVTDQNIHRITWDSSFGSETCGNVAQAGLSEEFLMNDLTVIGALEGGGGLGEVDLIYIGTDFVGPSFAAQDLAGASFRGEWLAYADFSGANLSGADFRGSSLSGANFTGAIIGGADFRHTAGLTAPQLYSTASYQQGELSATNFGGNDLSGFNFAGKILMDTVFSSAILTDADFTGANLMGAHFGGATLTDTNLTAADLRGAEFFSPANTTVTRNTVWPYGVIKGLDILPGDTFTTWDYSLRIWVRQGFAVADGGALQVILDDGTWGPQIAFGPEVTPQLGGTLRIRLGAHTNPTELIGTTFDLFNWNKTLDESNRFAQVELPPGTAWDLSQLYTTGEVVLTAASPPLSISTTNNQTTAAAGESVAYTITVSNPGDEGVAGANFTSTFPDQIDNVIWRCFAPAGSHCAGIGFGDITDSISLSAGGSVTYTATGTLDVAAQGQISTVATVLHPITGEESTATDTDIVLAVGDANRDGEFNQHDIALVLQSAKYQTGEPATWSEGDWNEDGMFDQKDIVAALQTGNYLQGPYVAEAVANALVKATDPD